MRISFSKFKDRIWFAFDAGSRRLVTAPRPIRSAVYRLIQGLLLALYYVPNSPLRRTSHSFSAVIGKGPPRRLHADFSRNFVIGLERMEFLRNGPLDKIDALLRIPEQDRLDALLEKGGVLMAMPHCQATVLSVRCLASRYPTLMIVRTTAKKSRADAQWTYYEKLGCDVVDVRRNSEAKVAREVLRAIRAGKIVIGVVDRLNETPPASDPVNKVKDTVRVKAFGQPVGVPGWPVRFAAKCRVPVLPVMVEQTHDALTFHIGAEITGDEMVATTQRWFDVLEDFIRTYPSDWLFLYDKHWAKCLKNAEQDLKN